MALDPDEQARKAEGSSSDARPTVSGPAADDGSTALLQQIASQLGALTAQVTELQSDLEEVREESAAIREQTGAPKTKRLAYLGNRPSEPPATSGPGPAAGGQSVGESEVGPWKPVDKHGFADELEEAMTNVEEASCEDQPESEETDLLPDEDPFITAEMLSEMESDDEPERGGPMSDDDAKRLLSEAAEQAEELHADAKHKHAADQGQEAQAEAQELPTIAHDQPAEHDPEQAADSDESVTDDEIQQLLAGFAKTAQAAAEEKAERKPILEDELQEVVSKTHEAATDAHPKEPLRPQSSGEGEVETVEVGFTAFQAGKEVGDETAAAQEESPPKQRREVVEPTFEVDPEAVAKVPAHLAIAALAIPVRVDEEDLVLRIAEPIDRIAFDIIGDATALNVKSEPAPMEEVIAALRTAYGSDSCSEERQAVADVAPRKLGKGIERRSRRAFKKVKLR